MQWLPQKWQVQWLFLVYRWVLALYYLAWLIVAGVQATGPTFFIYLTNWALIMWVVYLLTAAVSSTTNFFQVNFCCKNKFAVDSKGPRKPYELLISTPVGCCGVGNDGISWYQKIHWFLFTVALGGALLVVILYWPLVYNPATSALDGLNINSHLTNGIMSLVDVWISGTPVRIFHMIYLQGFGATYITFSAVYFAANGTNDQGQPDIYSALDYGNFPGTAAAIVIITVLVGLPIVHLIHYLLYVLRIGCLYLVTRCCNAYSQKWRAGTLLKMGSPSQDYGTEEKGSSSELAVKKSLSEETDSVEETQNP